MRAVAQRVRECSITVEGEVVAEAARALLLYVGIAHGDDQSDVQYIADKAANLRVFRDSAGKMNLSVLDLGYDIVVISQFTLYGDVRRGRRPSYDAASNPDHAEQLYRRTIEELRARGVSTQEGRFQAVMDVRYVNEGPVTILLDSKKQF
ncbi:D-aminoacyl-tRNA deacylase [Salinispira pacifica]